MPMPLSWTDTTTSRGGSGGSGASIWAGSTSPTAEQTVTRTWCACGRAESTCNGGRAYVPVRFRGGDAFRVAREQIDLVRRLTDRYDDLVLVLTLDEARRAHASGKIASMIGVEGGHAIDNSLDNLRSLFDAGARYLTLTHSASLEWADAAGDTPIAGGLSRFGREVVAEMNRLGMIVDISHVTDETMHDVLDVTTAPVIFSHSSARALADHPRNVPDDVLARVTGNGGVVMVNFFSAFLTPDGAANVQDIFVEEARLRRQHPDPDAFRAALQEWYRDRLTARGDVATIVDHIDHIVSVAGVDHVGLGSDFDGRTDVAGGHGRCVEVACDHGGAV